MVPLGIARAISDSLLRSNPKTLSRAARCAVFNRLSIRGLVRPALRPQVCECDGHVRQQSHGLLCARLRLPRVGTPRDPSNLAPPGHCARACPPVGSRLSATLPSSTVLAAVDRHGLRMHGSVLAPRNSRRPPSDATHAAAGAGAGFHFRRYQYSLLSSIGTAGLNNIINDIPARDLEEFNAFPQVRHTPAAYGLALLSQSANEHLSTLSARQQCRARGVRSADPHGGWEGRNDATAAQRRTTQAGVDFIKKWLDWADDNIRFLSNTRTLWQAPQVIAMPHATVRHTTCKHAAHIVTLVAAPYVTAPRLPRSVGRARTFCTRSQTARRVPRSTTRAAAWTLRAADGLCRRHLLGPVVRVRRLPFPLQPERSASPAKVRRWPAVGVALARGGGGTGPSGRRLQPR